jgi:hypothetical protein
VRWSQYLAIVWQQESLPEGSSEPLGTQVTENEDECDEVNVSPIATIRTPEDNGATTSMPKPKKVKISRNEKEGGLISTFKGVGEILLML